MPDQQQAVNALLSGEIDYLEQPAHDLLPLLEGDDQIKVVDYNKMGNQFGFRPNHLLKPFDNPKIRQALWYALNQRDILEAAIGNPDYYMECKSMYPCGTELATDAGTEGLLTSDYAKSKELLKEAGYDGTPIVLLHSTDYKVLANVAPTIKQMLEKGGFKVDMQTMDFQTHVTRRTKMDPVEAGGWNAFAITFSAADVLTPLAPYLNASCKKAISGWPCDEKLQQLRIDFARATTEEEQKKIAAEVQKRAIEITAYVNLGQYSQPLAIRKSLDGIVPTFVPVFWGITKH
jgi:peptide/nickel transport system substrate-binding protein